MIERLLEIEPGHQDYLELLARYHDARACLGLIDADLEMAVEAVRAHRDVRSRMRALGASGERFTDGHCEGIGRMVGVLNVLADRSRNFGFSDAGVSGVDAESEVARDPRAMVEADLGDAPAVHERCCFASAAWEAYLAEQGARDGPKEWD